MATYTPKRLTNPTVLTTSYVTQYAAPSATTTIVKQLIISNPTGTAATVNVSIVPSGGSASTSNNILGGLTVSANSTLVFDLSQVLATGDFISALASAGSTLNIVVSGVEVA